MILFWKQEKQTTTNSIAAEPNDKQKAGLQYIGGYALQYALQNILEQTQMKANKPWLFLRLEKLEVMPCKNRSHV